MAGSLHRLAVYLNQRRRSLATSLGSKPRVLPRRVISIGNIIVGGAGKTPLVEALAREWLRRGGRPALLSRGYGGGREGNDEFSLLQRRLPGVPHAQDKHRYRAGMFLLDSHPEIDLFLLDDGFQHRSLHRDLDLVVLDATRPFGQEQFFPQGYLRESWQALRRAEHFVITRPESTAPQKLAILHRYLAEQYPTVPVCLAEVEWEGVRSPRGNVEEPDLDKRWGAFAGIGNPAPFFRSLERAGLKLVGTRGYRDHHRFRDDDLTELRNWADRVKADALICTEKDGVKLERLKSFATMQLSIYQLRIRYRLSGAHPLDSIA